MFVTNWNSTTKIQKISEITNFFRHYFLSRTEVGYGEQLFHLLRSLSCIPGFSRSIAIIAGVCCSYKGDVSRFYMTSKRGSSRMNYIIYNNVYPWTSPYAYLRFLWLRVFCLLPFLPLEFISLAPADLSLRTGAESPARVKSSCFFSRLACATLMRMVSPN